MSGQRLYRWVLCRELRRTRPPRSPIAVYICPCGSPRRSQPRVSGSQKCWRCCDMSLSCEAIFMVPFALPCTSPPCHVGRCRIQLRECRSTEPRPAASNVHTRISQTRAFAQPLQVLPRVPHRDIKPVVGTAGLPGALSYMSRFMRCMPVRRNPVQCESESTEWVKGQCAEDKLSTMLACASWLAAPSLGSGAQARH